MVYNVYDVRFSLLVCVFWRYLNFIRLVLLCDKLFISLVGLGRSVMFGILFDLCLESDIWRYCLGFPSGLIYGISCTNSAPF